ncbi:hypothetical protein [Salinilacihabitans rarus]|uniref:hypothetical protein n=1 Tax=Salinilacihabitans rarus TaxID=2961596 RepID=UPI0020C887D1|nr:hypothetical protein [Salinilacihabitans rarus]
MAFEIDIREELHFPQLERCPDAVQRDFRDAFKDLQAASVSDVKNTNLDFLERIPGRPEYNIVSTTATEEYVVVFEIEENPDGKDTLRVLRIGKKSNLLE